jgi:hypothetical protein
MRVLAFLLPVLLAGCAFFQPIEDAAPVEAKAPVGGAVYSQATYWTKTGHRLLDGYKGNLGMGSVAVASGDLVYKGLVEGRVAYCSDYPAYTDSSARPVGSACFVDTDNDGKFDAVAATPGGVWLEKAIAPPVRYSKPVLVLPGSDSFRYELLYTGIGNDSLRLSYREYLNEAAKPTAFLDVIYDFRQQPTTITFRAVQIDVLRADNSQIVYRVLKGF